MLSINSFELKPSYDGLILQWVIDATKEYTFDIKRSESPNEFNGSIISGNQIEDPSQFKDVEVRHGQKNRVWHYQLMVSENGSQETKVVSIQPEKLRISRVILEKQARILRQQFGGRTIRVFIRKTIGPKCKCWDDRRSRRIKSNCEICYGTGIVGGYYASIEAQASFFPSPMIENIGKFGIQTQNIPMLWLSDFPELKSGQNSGDVIYDTIDKKHLKVLKVEKASLHKVLTQKMQLKELRKEDIESSLGLAA